MKKRFTYSVWSFFYLWKLNYLTSKVQRQLDALRKHVAGHVELYPYSMVFSELNERLSESQERIMLVRTSSTFDELLTKLTDLENQKLMDKFDAVMLEADTFLESLGGDDFLEGLK